MSDPINPDHYRKHPSGIECIEITRFMNFNKGNAIKYIWRAGDKGNEIEDLEKAVWYLHDEITLLKAGHEAAKGGPSVTVTKEAMARIDAVFNTQPGTMTHVNEEHEPSDASVLLQTVGK